jgi:hypothetical protein
VWRELGKLLQTADPKVIVAAENWTQGGSRLVNHLTKMEKENECNL